MNRLTAEDRKMLVRILTIVSKMQDDIFKRLHEDHQARILELKTIKDKTNETLADNS